MRAEFFKLIHEQMRKDESLFLLVADMGFGYTKPIQDEFPDRFLNVGIAEQDLIGVAAGLSNVGYRPICYTISNFLIHRCFEQIRDDICHHHIPAILVGTSTGFDNGFLGPTHQTLDDIGCIKALPYINVYSPSTKESVPNILNMIWGSKEPSYIRFGKGSLSYPTADDSLNQLIKQSGPTLVITHGSMLENCLGAYNIWPHFSLLVMNKVVPIDNEWMSHVFNFYNNILVVEDHKKSGLYNSLCQCVMELKRHDITLSSISVPNIFEHVVGDSNFYSERYGFTPEKIVEHIKLVSKNE